MTSPGPARALRHRHHRRGNHRVRHRPRRRAARPEGRAGREARLRQRHHRRLDSPHPRRPALSGDTRTSRWSAGPARTRDAPADRAASGEADPLPAAAAEGLLRPDAAADRDAPLRRVQLRQDAAVAPHPEPGRPAPRSNRRSTPSRFHGAALFYDCQCASPERLTLENAIDASGHGAPSRTTPRSSARSTTASAWPG